MADLGDLLKIRMLPYGQWNVIQRAFLGGGLRRRVATAWTDTPKKWAAIAEAKIASSLLSGRYDSLMDQPNKLSDVTIMLKGHGIPLIQSRTLYRSITHKKLGDGAWFGGVDPTAYHKGANMPVWQLALIQEGGISVGVTKKMRGWFAARGINLRKAAIVIPSRPFIKQGILDTMKEFKKEAKKTAQELIERLS